MIGEKWRAFWEDIQGHNLWYILKKIVVHYIFFFKTYDKEIAKSARRRWGQILAFWVRTRIPGWKGTTNRAYDRELIVSLTSYPARIDAAVDAVRSLLLQNRKPNRILLWLATEQFPNREADCPKRLREACRYGLEIRWCDDLRSYKKLIPALEEFPEAVIVTTDDDVLYRRTMLQKLHDAYRSNPSCIWAHNVSTFIAERGELIGRVWMSYPETMWDWALQRRSVRNMKEFGARPLLVNEAVGCYGVLYPPHVLHPDVLNRAQFSELCPTNDDIWFWLMAVRIGTKTCTPKDSYCFVSYVKGTQEQPEALYHTNEGKGRFGEDFHRLLRLYPELKGILCDAFAELIGSMESS
ncbi:MAG: hypothetical protein IJK01_05430 [Clostridia bacterium]|nr:hypothetical protein [Clostridia bacterium]